jgi:hypothetical protein
MREAARGTPAKHQCDQRPARLTKADPAWWRGCAVAAVNDRQGPLSEKFAATADSADITAETTSLPVNKYDRTATDASSELRSG